MTTPVDATARRDALVEGLLRTAIGTFDLFSVYLGDVLGLYRALADRGPLPPSCRPFPDPRRPTSGVGAKPRL